MSSEKKPVLISADWGTSSFRAFLLDRQGGVLGQQEASMGIMKVPDGDFEAAFSKLMGRWLHDYPDLPVLLSGMIGSEQGWSLAPHVPLPAGLAEIASSLHTVPITKEKCAYIVPGLTTKNSYDVHDIIRGEETQILGALDQLKTGDRVLCLPGTHSKWATVKEGAITGFHTSLTGEALAVLSEHSILGRLMEAPTTKETSLFEQGLERATQKGGLLHHLFGVRSQGFKGDIPQTGLKPYLAGILIGHEIQGMLEIYPHLETITIIAGREIGTRYDHASRFFGMQPTLINGETAAFRGHLQIARTAGFTT